MNAATRSPTSPWTQLQTELRDLAFLLDRQGSHAAADLATMISARIGELIVEPTASRMPHLPSDRV